MARGRVPGGEIDRKHFYPPETTDRLPPNERAVPQSPSNNFSTCSNDG